MDDKFKNSIEDALTARQEQKDAHEKARAEEKRRQEEFNEEFNKLNHEIIKPALKEMVDYLKTKGITAEIQENSGATAEDSIRYIHTTAITFKHGSRSIHNGRFPCVKFQANRNSPSITIFESTMGGSAGGRSGNFGDYSLDQITKDFVLERVTKIVTEII